MADFIDAFLNAFHFNHNCCYCKYIFQWRNCRLIFLNWLKKIMEPQRLTWQNSPYLYTVKNREKILGVLTFSVLCYTFLHFAFSFYNNQDVCFSTPENSTKTTSFSPIQVNSLGNALPVKIISVKDFFCVKTVSSFSFKIIPGVFKTVEQAFTKLFSRYVFQSVNFPIRLKKANLIFPFHNFW